MLDKLIVNINKMDMASWKDLILRMKANLKMENLMEMGIFKTSKNKEVS